VPEYARIAEDERASVLLSRYKRGSRAGKLGDERLGKLPIHEARCANRALTRVAPTTSPLHGRPFWSPPMIAGLVKWTTEPGQILSHAFSQAMTER